MSKIKKNRNRSYDFDHFLPKTFNLLPYTHCKAVDSRFGQNTFDCPTVAAESLI